MPFRSPRGSGTSHRSDVAIELRTAPGELAWGPLRVDLIRGLAQAGELELRLQSLQLRILALLMLHAGEVVRSEQLRRDIFRAAQAPRSTGIARQISVLRARLGPFARFIATERGGYALRYPQ
jgi:DNA-binding response OmpR family regulator